MRPERAPTPTIELEPRVGKFVFIASDEHGKCVGHLAFQHFNKPFPGVEMLDINVEEEHQGKGYGSYLMAAVENYLKKNKLPGVLLESDDIPPHAEEMYARRGWVPAAKGGRRFGYNLPPEIPVERINDYFEFQNELNGEEQRAYVASLKRQSE